MSAIFLAVMEGNVMAGSWQGQRQLRGSRQYRIQKLKASRPNQKLQGEGGTPELWDQTEDQFKCVGLAAMRNTIQPHSLFLPNYHLLVSSTLRKVHSYDLNIFIYKTDF